MLGAIIGDICGSAYEFDNVKRKDIELFPREASITDDTVMTVAVGMAMMDSRFKKIEYRRQAVIDAMKYFGHLYPDAGYGSRFYMWLRLFNTESYNSCGNGSGMRVSSVGWLFDTLEETLLNAKISAEVTHNHPEGIKGAQAIAGSIFLARNGKSKDEIKEFVTKFCDYDLDFTLDEIRPTYYHDETCQKSVPQAIVAFLESTDFEDAIRCAISIGGDSDTIADMTGAIAEAYYGGIPGYLKNKAMSYLPDSLKTVVERFYKEKDAMESEAHKNSIIIKIDDSNINELQITLKNIVLKAITIGKATVDELYKQNIQVNWPEKLAGISFRYNGQWYELPYDLFGIQPEDQAYIYYLNDSVVKYLKEEGCLDARAMGFMD